MSEFTERTYYDPYSRTQKPVLTDEEVKRMWPYKEAKHKRTTMDDAMPNLDPRPVWTPEDHAKADAQVALDEDLKAMAEIEGAIQKRRLAKDFKVMAQMELFPEVALMQDVAAANVASAEERGVPGDAVVLPNHYARFKIEPIRFLVENFGAPILVGKIVKYSLRYDAKNGMEDLRKARRCMDMLIKYVEGDPDWWKADR